MTIQQDLTAVWKQAIRAGHICNRFRDWQGRAVQVGIRLGDRGPEHYAIDTEQGSEIGADVVEREVEGSGLRVQWNQFRALKPQVRPAGLGRQDDFPAAARDCFFACQNSGHPLSLLRRNRLVHLSLSNHQWAALYNAFPVEKDGHFLWLPVSIDGARTGYPHWLQVLTHSFSEDFLELARASTGTFDSLQFAARGSLGQPHSFSERGAQRRRAARPGR